ncbi:MAG: hypothetical protein SCALA702_36850 [Melioribacteraceae bacterium]|nr:MAG: hypothetical protein SCALA702_36850 [Melioribacteraceae bacterium]
MNRFMPLLREINSRLALPQPLKSRVILEISGDIEDTFDYYINKGFTESDAEKKTLDKFSLSEESLAELINLHTSQYKSWLNNLSENTRAIWEKTLLSLVMMIVLVSFYTSINSAPFFQNTSYFTYPVLALFFITIGAGLIKFYQFYVVKKHETQKLRTGLNLVLYLTLVTFFTGVFGYFAEQYLSSGAGILSGEYFFLGLLTNAESLAQSVDWMIRSTSLMMTTLGVSLTTLLIWFFLTNKAGSIEEAEVSILLENH